MPFEQAVFLSLVAGATIFLGLPVGRLRNLSARTQVTLTAAAGGIILFLIWDILTQAIEPVETALVAVRDDGAQIGDLLLYGAGLVGGVAFGLLSIVWATSEMRRRRAASEPTGSRSQQVALATAAGLGLHNLSEGLAIGNSAATGATSIALVLVIGFALHNATEGFGIAAPLTSGPRPTWGFLALAGRHSSAASSAIRSWRHSRPSCSWASRRARSSTSSTR
jgi:ZIP family zinc transporter